MLAERSPPTPGPACARTTANIGLLLTLAPATLMWAPSTWPTTTMLQVTLLGRLAAVVCILTAALGLARAAAWARVVGAIGVVLAAAAFIVEHSTAPGRGFVILVVVTFVLLRLWPAEALRHRAAIAGPGAKDADVVAASAVAAAAAAGGWFAPTLGLAGMGPLAVTLAIPVLLAWRSGLWRDLAPWRRRLVPGLGLLSAAAPPGAAGLAALGLEGAGALLLLGVVGPVVTGAVAVGRRAARRVLTPSTEPSLLDVLLLHPPRVLVVSFTGLCGLATMLLALPASSTDGLSMGLLDAAFTAVSATCVTGLAVKDTVVDVTLFGQLVILLFIQVGGLGIMVFSAAAIVVLGRRLSVQHEAAAVDLVGASGRAGLGEAIRSILLVSLATELVSAGLLTIAFLDEGDDLIVALWRGVFTAISAFCNAGFALQSTSLVPYQENPFILVVVAVTIIAGGLGPPVVLAMAQRRRLGVQQRLVLWTSAVFVLVPFVLILMFEWTASLRELSVPDRISNALFQSVTLRTAGFNSIDFSQITPATWTVMLAAMFVGGSPGSTAGGVKTTTVGIIALAVFAILRGHDRVEVANRSIPPTTVLRATAVMTVGMLSCVIATMALQLTQQIPLDHLIFEVVSALGTVGLSMGATSQLDEVGKVVIILAMFAGRIGPLTFFMFLASRASTASRLRRPEEQIAVG